MLQKDALEKLKTGKNIFLTGEPGSGKTYTVNLFMEHLRAINKPYAVTASTGIAATHIGGVTIHSWTGLGIKRKLDENSLRKILWNERIANNIKKTRVLIIDEISMLDATTINLIDVIIRKIRNTDEVFGGLQVVFVGDFFQLPPVNTSGQAVEFAFESDVWKKLNFDVCYLSEQHRQEDEVFLGILKAMRDGRITESHKDLLKKNSPEEIPITHLYTHNADVDRINEMELNKIPGNASVFPMKTDGIPYVIQVLQKAIITPIDLKLKVGALVMFTRNDNVDMLYANGTIGNVTSLDPLKIKIKGSDEVIEVQRAEWVIEENNVVKAACRQYPLRLAYAITVHKSQGMSLDSASVDLSKAFEFGQGYVAISRVRSLKGLHLVGIGDGAFSMHPKVIEFDKKIRS